MTSRLTESAVNITQKLNRIVLQVKLKCCSVVCIMSPAVLTGPTD